MLGLAGCMSSGPRLTQQQYEAKMQALTHEMQADGAAMKSFAASPSATTFDEILEQAADAFRDAADELDDMNPPEEIDGAHDDLVDSFRDVADVLDEAAEEADDGDFYAAMAKLSEGDDAASKAEEAIREIRTAGYYIGDDSSWGSWPTLVGRARVGSGHDAGRAL